MNYLNEVVRIKKLMDEEDKQKQKITQHEISVRERDSEKRHYDKPGTIENTTAVILYILTMIIGSVFVDRIYIYISATLALLCYFGRHSYSQKKRK